MGLTLLDGVVSLSCLCVSYLLYTSSRPSPQKARELPRAFILHSTTSHARFLPADARHAFTYPVLSLLLPLSALESGRLSLLNGFLFSFGSVYGRILGMRSAGYLYDDGGSEPSIRKKLVNALQDFGVQQAEEQMDDAWILTMPSYFGFEGINPLTVYFCYRKGNPDLWIVVLEVHNTFGERHIYILEVGKNEEPPDAKFDHQWSFARAFHVSPFNDRLGTYTISVRAPFPSGDSDMILPLVRVRMYTPEGALKLSASLRAKYAPPFRTHTVLASLVAHPFILFLTFPRIVSEAAVLHYRRRLAVYKRPEPKPVRWTTIPSSTAPTPSKGGGIGWLHPTLLESAAWRVVNSFLTCRADALGVCITLQPGDPSEPIQRFGTHHDEEDKMNNNTARKLVISYLSPRFFTLLVLAGDARTALRRGGEVTGDVPEFVVSNEELFCEIFDAGTSRGATIIGTWAARLLRLLPGGHESGDDQAHRHTENHPRQDQDEHPLVPESRMGQAGFMVLVSVLVALEWVQEMFWRVARVRWAHQAPVPHDVAGIATVIRA